MLRHSRARATAAVDYQRKLVRFLENHDEPRAAATFAPGQHKAAAIITYLSPGLRFLHQGQFEGRRKRISPHLVRAPAEPADAALRQFYERLLTALRQPTFRDGDWRLLDCVPAWDGNWTWDCFIAALWQGAERERRLIAVNYGANQSQCFVRLALPELSGRVLRLSDLMGSASFERDGSDLVARGLYLDMPPWGYHAFDLAAA